MIDLALVLRIAGIVISKKAYDDAKAGKSIGWVWYTVVAAIAIVAVPTVVDWFMGVPRS